MFSPLMAICDDMAVNNAVSLHYASTYFISIQSRDMMPKLSTSADWYQCQSRCYYWTIGGQIPRLKLANKVAYIIQIPTPSIAPIPVFD